jgi:hypothetical protein
MSARYIAIALLLPVLLLGFIVGQAEWRLAHSKTWLFAMEGYDPRDLLRGHYLRFQLSVATAQVGASCTRDDPDCCYCLAPGETIGDAGVIAEATVVSCAEAVERCEDFVRARPLLALDRFYIPEDNRRAFEDSLQAATAKGAAHLAVAVAGDGSPMISGVWVNGVPIATEVLERESSEATTSADDELALPDDG